MTEDVADSVGMASIHLNEHLSLSISFYYLVDQQTPCVVLSTALWTISMAKVEQQKEQTVALDIHVISDNFAQNSQYPSPDLATRRTFSRVISF